MGFSRFTRSLAMVLVGALGFAGPRTAQAADGARPTSLVSGPVRLQRPRIMSVEQAQTPARTKTTILRLPADELRRAHLDGSGVSIAQFPLNDIESVDLELRPFRVTGANSRFVIGRLGAPDVPFDYDTSRLSFFHGSVVGRPGSHVYLSVSDRTTSGYIDLGAGAGLHRLSSKGSAGQTLERGLVSVFKSSGAASAPDGVPMCGVEGDKVSVRGAWIDPPPRTSAGSAAQSAGSVAQASTVGLKHMELAVETDYELFTLFGDPTATMDYVVQVYGEVSSIYMRDVDMRIQVVFVRVWDQANDLFNGPEPLFQFYPWWIANMGAVSRDSAQFFSGRRDFPFGGQAFISRLCDLFGYGIVGYAVGALPDPLTPHPFNWDVSVTAHELGHSSGTAHTHDNGIDTCDNPFTTPRRGPIMSYCGQTWSGMNANMDNYFHAVSQASMDSHIATASCVVPDCNMNDVDDSLDIGGGASADSNFNGIPDECEDCNGNGTLDPVDIAGASLDLNFNGIPDECEPDCNGNGVPDDRDILLGTSTDAFGNDVPDECEVDCNGNGTSDYTEIQANITRDKNRDAILDACQDCNTNGTTDLVELSGAHHLWVTTGLPNETVRQFLGSTGVLTVETAAGLNAVNAGQDLIVSPTGLILVTSGSENRVRAFTSTGAAAGDFVSAGSGGLVFPTGLIYSPTGDLLVCSRDTNSVLRYDGTTGAPLGAFVASGSGGLVSPFGLTFGPNGNLYVTSAANEVIEYDGATGAFVRVFVTASNRGTLDQPRGLAFKPDANLLVASFGTDEVLEFERFTGAPRGKWAHVGTVDRITQDSPWGIRVGPNGHVFVTRTGEDNSSNATVGLRGPDAPASHLTDARMFEYDVCNGDFRKTEIGGMDHGLDFATGFDFVPGFSIDCNVNELVDSCDIASGTSLDTNLNGIPDECEVDCNGNGTYDRLDIYPFGSSLDCNCNFVPDDCDLLSGSTDCNGNGILDECEIDFDCNTNGTQDICDIAAGAESDCNANNVIDACEAVSSGVLLDEDFEGGLPAGWSATGVFSVTGACSGFGACADNGSSWAYAGNTAGCSYGDGVQGGLVSPLIDLPPGSVQLQYCSALATEFDFDFADVVINNVLVERLSGGSGAWETRVVDISEFAGETIQIIFRLESDSGASGALGWLVDNVVVTSGSVSEDCDGDGLPDECGADCNESGIPDTCDIADGTSEDCNENSVPDECDIALGTSLDEDLNGIPDECAAPPPPPITDATGGAGHGQRYLEVSAPGGSGSEVIRVTPLNIPGLTGGADVLYLGAPFVAPDPNLVDSNVTFIASQLVCDPVPADFGAFSSIAVYGAEVTPSDKLNIAQYSVQRADASCPDLATNEACWSTPVVISQGHFGDVISPYWVSAGSVEPSFLDISAYVSKFLGDPGALSKPAMQLTKNLPRPQLAVSFLDISAAVGSFLGTQTYATAPFATGLCTCPSSVTCALTPCSVDVDCGTGLCDTIGVQSGRLCDDLTTPCTSDGDCAGIGGGVCGSGYCVDACGRCSP